MNEDFLWRSEMACRAAWPAETEIGLGRWSARRSGGTIRRVNSLNPLPGATELAEATIDRTGDFYAGYGQPALVRLLSFAGTASADPLARRGYRLEGKTTTLCADLRNRAPVGGSETKVWDIPDPEWLAVWKDPRIKAVAEAYRRNLLTWRAGHPPPRVDREPGLDTGRTAP